MQVSKSSPNLPGVTYTSPAQIRQQVANMVKAKKIELVGKNSGSPTLGSKPKLGHGLSRNTEIDLQGDWLSPKRAYDSAQVRKVTHRISISAFLLEAFFVNPIITIFPCIFREKQLQN